MATKRIRNANNANGAVEIMDDGTASDLRVTDTVTPTTCSAVPTGRSYTTKKAFFNVAVASGLTQFRPYIVQGASANGYVAFDSEL